jgi:hypothetical protein
MGEQQDNIDEIDPTTEVLASNIWERRCHQRDLLTHLKDVAPAAASTDKVSNRNKTKQKIIDASPYFGPGGGSKSGVSTTTLL